MSTVPAAVRLTWRTPAVILVCGCIIALLSFGPRSAVGQFLTPLSQAHGWGRDVFALALAIQNLLWGVGQPFAGRLPIASAPSGCCGSAPSSTGSASP